MNRVKQCVVSAFFMVLSLPALAHPHSFIDIQTGVVVKNGQFTGLSMRWKMDEITSADLLYDAGNAKPGDEVWKKLAAEVMANVLGQHYFTEVWHDGKKVKFENRPDGYGLAREGHQAVLTFTLPLAEPQPLAGQTYTFSTYDPTYYVDMTWKNDHDISLPAAQQNACRVTLTTPEPNEKMTTYALSLDKADAPPEDMELGQYFAQKVTLKCQ
ncbi:DUF1007 family protein [Yokenella regensburgei]|uniref:DUF1007 family protein n=1 Tax=Yokenella regensburgei TaxID=158877 RepID=UPI0027D95907|nr:DUF1007 family protein [Yokenella regensburgei]MDQ4428975.1 DUF1007 family protein [Yokenella regensburgei]